MIIIFVFCCLTSISACLPWERFTKPTRKRQRNFAEPTKKRCGCKNDFRFWNINLWPRWCHYVWNLLTWCRSFRNKASFACWRNQLFLISTHSAPLLTWKYAPKIWSQIVDNWTFHSWKFRFSREIFCLVTLARSCIRWTARTNLTLSRPRGFPLTSKIVWR